MSEEADMAPLTKNPSLRYLSEILMEEGEDDDAACLPQVDDGSSYQAIFSGFCDILGASAIPSPADGHGFKKETSEVGLALKHDSSFQGHVIIANHTPLNTMQFPETKSGICNRGSCLNSNDLSCDSDTATQNNGTAINLNDGGCTDVMVSCWGKDAIVEGLRNHRQAQAQEQEGICKLPLTDEEFSSKLAGIELSFEELNLNDVYTDLYVGKLDKHSRDKKKSVAGNGSKLGKRSATLEANVSVDVKVVLMSCAQAVAIGDARRSEEILQDLRRVYGASANGTSLQRIAHYFSKALAARMMGIGEHQFKALFQKMPSALNLFKGMKVGFERIPFVKVIHYFANQNILKAAEGASRLHIVDYGLMHGIQWPCLLSALAERKGGPPLLVITGIEFPQPGINPAKRLEESGQQLAAFAKAYDVPFQYHAVIVNKLGDLDVAALNLHKGEVLVVNCIRCLRHLSEESMDLSSSISPRQKLLNLMRNLNPCLLLMAGRNAAYNLAVFVSRFREALYFFSNGFDMLDTVLGDTPQRLMLERCSYREILNIVACEGAERTDRPETYKQWHVRIVKAGFEQLPILPTIVSRARSHVNQHYHKDFLIHDDGKGWMLMGWKGCTRLAVSAWKPSLA